MNNIVRTAMNKRDQVLLGRLLLKIKQYEESRPKEQLGLFNTQRAGDLPNSKRRNRRLAG